MTLKPPDLTNSPLDDRLVTGQVFQGYGGYDFNVNGVPNQTAPVGARFATGATYADSGAGNIFHVSSYVENTGTRATVALFGGARGPHAFGVNGVALTNGSGSAIAGEFDAGNLSVAGGTATVLVAKSVGGNVGGTGAASYFQMQAAASSAATDGILWHVSGTDQPVAAAGSLMRTNGAVTCAIGLNLTSFVPTTAAIVLPANGHIAGEATTGFKIGTSSAQKIGFWNATPVVRQTLPAAGVVTAADIRSLLITVGLAA